MACTPIAVSFEVIDPDEKLIKVNFGLARACNNDGSSTWSIDFRLFERDNRQQAFGDPLIKFDLVVGPQNHALAERAANNGLTEAQQQQALAAADTAKAVKAGEADPEEAQADAEAVLTAGVEESSGIAV